MNDERVAVVEAIKNGHLGAIDEGLRLLRELADRDVEAAHGLEDGMREAVLRAIASGTIVGPDVERAAVAVLQTRIVEFGRYCA